MSFLSQSNFPRIWLLMQKIIGGNSSKQQLAIKYYNDENRVLEIGCSVGNISEVFLPYKNISYTGIDIDPVAIKVARKRFEKSPNFVFDLCSLADLVKTKKQYDYIVFAGILHHVDDEGCKKLLCDALKLVAENGRLVISEPEALKASDNRIFKFFYKLEQGLYLRSRSDLERLVISSGAKIESSEDCLINPGIIKNTYVARFNLICATHP